MNKTYKYTLTAHEKKEISFDTGVARLAIANGDGVDGSTTVVMSEITKQHSGDLVSFIDGADAPFADFIVNIEAVQSGSGDPSPTNVRPISGWKGAKVIRTSINVWDEEWELGGISDTTGANWSASDRIRSKNYIPILPNTQYYWKSNAAFGVIAYYDADKNFISAIVNTSRDTVKTSPEGAYYVRFQEISAYGTTYNNDISINYPATDTAYHAYNGNTYNIDWQDEAGTVGGGSVDIINGEIMANKVGIKGVTVARIGTSSSGVRYVDTTHIYENLVENTPTISDRYKQIDTSVTAISGQFRVYNGIFTIYDDRFTDFDTAQSLLNDVEFYYELATPVTYQLTPLEIRSLLGVNNVWADCGPVNVRYFVQSTQPMIDYIDGKVVEVFKATGHYGGTYTLDDVTCDELCDYARDHSNIVIKATRASSAIAYDIFILSDYIGTSAVFRNAIITTAIGGGYVLEVRELQADNGNSTNALTVRYININADS